VLLDPGSDLLTLFQTYHLVSTVILLALYGAAHLVKMAFRFLRETTDQVFDFITFLNRRWYRFLGDRARAINDYHRRFRTQSGRQGQDESRTAS